MATISSLTEVRTQLEAAYRTLPLVTKPEDIVPGEGTKAAEIVFIGEAPGYHESVQRRPFVGRSGQLFRSTLQAVGLREAEVYITNIVKARPPENRDPLPSEIAAYKPYLDAELQLLNPLLIVTLGRYSMAKFLPEVFISQVHGRLHKVKTPWSASARYVLPMYHPAAALRSTKVKESFIADFGKIKKIIAWVKEQQEVASLSEEVVKHLF